MKLFLSSEILLASSGYYELCVVNVSAVICVNSLEHLLDFLVRHNPAIVFKIPFLHFLHIKFAITIGVKCLKGFDELPGGLRLGFLCRLPRRHAQG